MERRKAEAEQGREAYHVDDLFSSASNGRDESVNLVKSGVDWKIATFSNALSICVAFIRLRLTEASVPTVYGLRQMDRLLPSAEGTAEGSRWKFLHLRQ